MMEERIQKEPLPEQSKKETEKELAKEAYVLREEETYGAKPEGSYEQGSFLKEEEMAKQKIIGQLFDTYWLVEYNDRLFIVDQHAAHEKVMYEKLKKQFEKKEFTSQAISPPIVITFQSIHPWYSAGKDYPELRRYCILHHQSAQFRNLAS